MEFDEEEFETLVSFRIPLSLVKSVMTTDWGMSRKDKKNKSKIYRIAIQEGVQFRKLKNIVKNNPDQIRHIHEKILSYVSEDQHKNVLADMTPDELENIILIATTFRDSKISQLILDV